LGSWKKSLSAGWSSMVSGGWGKDEWVKVEAFTGVHDKERTPVLVRVTAAPRRPRTTTDMDVVAVLNVSSNMKGKKMEQMKEAMQVVINNLGPKDRLSLVFFDDKARRPLKLTSMSKQGRADATAMIKGISTIGKASHDAEELRDGRLRCVMLMSGGETNFSLDEWSSKCKEGNFQVHAFGLGADHDATPFQCIVNKEGVGTYSFVNDDSKIADAFKVFVGGLKSVAATSVTVNLKAQAGFRIWSVENGGHKPERVQDDHYRIRIANMYAGEKKNFMFYLSQDQESAAAAAEKPLMTVDGKYQLFGYDNDNKPSLQAKDITMKTVEAGMQSEVAAEHVRIKLVEEVRDMAESKDVHVGDVQGKWETIKAEAERLGAHSTSCLLSELGKDVAEMMKPQGGRPYMLSWLSCHLWQRATTMSHHSSRAFRVRATREWGWKFVASLAAVVFVMVMLLRLLPKPPSGPLQTTPLDLVRHPHWSAMENELNVMVKHKKDDEAILHAAVLRARYEGTLEFPEKVVRSHAEAYLHAMLKRTKKEALPSMAVATTEEMANAMSQHLYSTIVQANVLVTIIEPPTEKTIEKLEAANVKLEKKINIIEAANAELEKKIKILVIEIDRRESCCQSAKKWEQKVKALGGSVFDKEDDGYVETKTIYYVDAKEVSQHK
ncbi:hypothetical protein BAE44_0009605, partial [Dichanthelium oligosanthes]